MKINKLFFSLMLLSSTQMKSQLIAPSAIDTYDPVNYFYTLKEDILQYGTQRLSNPNARTNTNSDLRLIKSSKDALGLSHYKYAQYYNNVKIDDAPFIVHTNQENKAIKANGKLYEQIELTTTPSISGETAIKNALTYTNAKRYFWENAALEKELKERKKDQTASYYPSAELVIKNISKTKTEDLKLCYKIHIQSQLPLDEYDLFVDAVSGAIVYKNQIGTSCFKTRTSTKSNSKIGQGNLESMAEQIETKNNTDDQAGKVQACSGNCLQGPASMDYYTDQYIYTQKFQDGLVCKYRTIQQCSGEPTLSVKKWISVNSPSNDEDYRDNTNNWTYITYRPGTTSLFCLKVASDYYRTHWGRNSYDGLGSQINLTAECNAAPNVIGERGNASWTSDHIYIGVAANEFVDDLTTIDIIGHELTHGVNRYEGDLVYQGESGALSESFSDIIGKTIDFYGKTVYSTGVTPNYLMSPEIVSGGQRDMSNPNSKGDPDTYLGAYWADPNSSYDHGNVHTNSGVQNYWFYLLAEGGSGTNDLGNQFCVTGIGRDKAVDIAYRSLTTYIGQNTNYPQARVCSIQAAIDLYGATSNEVAQVTQAWYAVGVGPKYAGPFEFNNLNVTTDQTIQRNAAIKFTNLTKSATANFTVTSNTEIRILPTSSMPPGSGVFRAYIAPAPCAGAAGPLYTDDVNTSDETSNTTTEIKTVEASEVFAISQNPTDGNFKILVGNGLEDQIEEVVVMDLLGNTAWKEQRTHKSTYDVNIGGVAAGIYYVRAIKSDGNTIVKKVVKQ